MYVLKIPKAHIYPSRLNHYCMHNKAIGSSVQHDLVFDLIKRNTTE